MSDILNSGRLRLHSPERIGGYLEPDASPLEVDENGEQLLKYTGVYDSAERSFTPIGLTVVTRRLRYSYDLNLGTRSTRTFQDLPNHIHIYSPWGDSV